MRSRVQGGDLVGDLADVSVHVDSGPREGGQPSFRRHAPHHDEVVARRSARIEHVGHTQVHVRREPLVELHLAVADRFAGSSGAKV